MPQRFERRGTDQRVTFIACPRQLRKS